jgi:DNA-binding IclR family transcriptional regulator
MALRVAHSMAAAVRGVRRMSTLNFSLSAEQEVNITSLASNRCVSARFLSVCVRNGFRWPLFWCHRGSSLLQELDALSKKFAREEIIPAARHHDQTGDFPWELIKKAQ